MLSLNEVKMVILRTECKNLLVEGLYCSEPILTKDSNGIIDNYFLYGANQDESEITSPLVIFGIYSEQSKVVYINETGGNHIVVPNHFPRSMQDQEIEMYSNLYSCIRSFVFSKNCSSKNRQEIDEYLRLLRSLSGDGLYGFYQSVAPEFFLWAEEMAYSS